MPNDKIFKETPKTQGKSQKTQGFPQKNSRKISKNSRIRQLELRLVGKIWPKKSLGYEFYTQYGSVT